MKKSDVPIGKTVVPHAGEPVMCNVAITTIARQEVALGR
jgi:hypothetical protein